MSEEAEEPGYNELRMVDDTDNELIYLQAQRDFQQLVKGNETERSGQNRATVVGQHRCSVVAATDARLVGEKFSIQAVEPPDEGQTGVGDLKELKILEQRKPDLKPLPSKVEMMDKCIMATSGQASVVMNKKEVVFNAAGKLSLTAAGDIIVVGGPNIKINC